ncbi:VOC family protein [Novosphingobium umbonatum]|uniref:VOC family protein n=1 Tax=Novosphingobium umbonatum TaxID=1908524 RepID=A0A3S2VTY1_9SPHN|nr:VOC family protein [Novosphingobium umbonatum]RVU05723.1 VOC family protein [Novosphingobium umbonatum]
MTKRGALTDLAPINQLAYLPSDFDAALHHWTQVVGAGPFFLMENIALGDMTYLGQPTDAVFSVAIGYWGDMQIELIRPENDSPSIYSGKYAVKDRLHHICMVVDDIEVARKALAEAGATNLVEGKVGEDGYVIYADAGGGPGNVLEYVQLMSGGKELFAMMRDAAKGWDGSDPLRKIG